MTSRLPVIAETKVVIARARKRLAAFEERRVDRQLLACRCAAHDLPFDAVFARRRANQRFTLETTRQGRDHKDGGSSVVAAPFRIKAEQFALGDLECPHCGARRFTLCAKCGAFVCGARSSRENGARYFRCAASCGSEGAVGVLTTIKTTKPAGARRLTSNQPLLRLPKPNN